jgi:CubicO group peptidase (beta-lactamase class C family)
LEDTMGQPFAGLMHDLVLAPLGMVDSTFAQPLPTDLRDRAAIGHRTDGQPVAGGWHVYPEQAPAGLWSTPTDLLRAALEVRRARAGQGSILGAASAEAMLTHGPVGNVGIGFFSGGEGLTRRFGHGGDNEGFKALLDVCIETGKGVAVLANGDLGDALINEIIGAVAREDGWPLVPGESFGTYRAPRSAMDVDAVMLDAVVGTYELRADYLLTLRYEHGRLLLTVPGQPPVSLRPVAEDRLEAAALELELTVEWDGDRVVGIVVHQGDDEQHATRQLEAVM